MIAVPPVLSPALQKWLNLFFRESMRSAGDHRSAFMNVVHITHIADISTESEYSHIILPVEQLGAPHWWHYIFRTLDLIGSKTVVQGIAAHQILFHAIRRFLIPTVSSLDDLPYHHGCIIVMHLFPQSGILMLPVDSVLSLLWSEDASGFVLRHPSVFTLFLDRLCVSYVRNFFLSVISSHWWIYFSFFAINACVCYL